MILVRDCLLSYLSKPSIDYCFTDSAGFCTEVLNSFGALNGTKYEAKDGINLVKPSAQDLFDVYHTQGGWNKFSIGALAFYGRSVVEIGSVSMIIDPYTVIGAHVTPDGVRVMIKPLHYRSGLAAVIKPSYSSIGYI